LDWGYVLNGRGTKCIDWKNNGEIGSVCLFELFDLRDFVEILIAFGNAVVDA